MTDYAHIKPTNEGWKTQSIKDHCLGTANLAEHMAEAFNAAPWARLCGLWHDIGKYSVEFQHHIISSSGFDPSVHDPGKVDHATAGALLAKGILGKVISLPIAYCICGHHHGLMDYEGNERSCLEFHLSSQEQHYLDDIRRFLPKEDKTTILPSPKCKDIKYWHIWIRMLFSCLVDADWLDTERFMNPEDFAARSKYKTLAQLKPILDKKLYDLSHSSMATKVNAIRNEVQDACRKSGALPQGIYSLTVPTGGGKTLSSLLWAMEHAISHGLQRIIIAIPYTSIVTQTADQLRKIFGSENIVEHHSYADFDNLKDEERHKMKLAIENWDAPIIVTTNVQLFESLYSNKTSRCRKLHNIAKSVLILDEVQTLPVENLRPIIDMLKGLSQSMSTSILFTTATQPAFSGTIGSGISKFEGLESKEIIHDVDGLFKKMRRVDINFKNEQYSYENLAREIAKPSQVLCIVNTRCEALQLYNSLTDKSNAFHLSRMMCQQHIADEISIIKERLTEGLPVQVISTQLIEAGVDIDFPEVWREIAGLDSIAQSAGRCNREGKLQLGHVYVFQREGAKLRGILAKAASTTQDLIYMGKTDFLSPNTAKDYLRLFYAKLNNTDKANINDLLYRKCPQFEQAANAFHMIDDNTLTIYVPYSDNGRALIEALMEGSYSQRLLRKLQRFSVNVPINRREEVERMGTVKLSDNVYVLTDSSNYNKKTGLTFENPWLDNELII